MNELDDILETLRLMSIDTSLTEAVRMEAGNMFQRLTLAKRLKNYGQTAALNKCLTSIESTALTDQAVIELRARAVALLRA
jgi:hypothetical protein